MLLFETLKNQKFDFLNSNTCFCSRLYGSTNYPMSDNNLSNVLVKQQEKSKWAKLVWNSRLIETWVCGFFFLGKEVIGLCSMQFNALGKRSQTGEQWASWHKSAAHWSNNFHKGGNLQLFYSKKNPVKKIEVLMQFNLWVQCTQKH